LAGEAGEHKPRTGEKESKRMGQENKTDIENNREMGREKDK
jgi:hypothetical protein